MKFEITVVCKGPSTGTKIKFEILVVIMIRIVLSECILWPSHCYDYYHRCYYDY